MKLDSVGFLRSAIYSVCTDKKNHIALCLLFLFFSLDFIQFICYYTCLLQVLVKLGEETLSRHIHAKNALCERCIL